MSLFPKSYNMEEVLVVYVCINSEQPFEDCLGDGQKVLWEWNTCRERIREYQGSQGRSSGPGSTKKPD